MNSYNKSLQYFAELKKNLYGDPLFLQFEEIIYELRTFLDSKEANFPNSNEGVFAKEVMHRVCEESLAYIGCLEKGAFFASEHHYRALIELYATTVFIAFGKGKKKRFLERFIRYSEIEFYKVYHDKKSAIFKFPKEILEEYFSQYADLDEELLKIYNKKTKEDLLTIKSWRGSCSIENLLSELPHAKEDYKQIYDNMCLFIHFSAVIKASELERFPNFDEIRKEMLAITMKSVIDIYSYLRGDDYIVTSEKFFTKEMIKKLDDIFLKAVPDLYSKIVSMQKKPLQNAIFLAIFNFLIF